MHIDIFKIIETCYYWLHIIQLHDAPFHFLINVLKALRFSAVLMLKGRAFQILGLKTVSTTRDFVCSRNIQI